jgi:hypothetical protein
MDAGLFDIAGHQARSLLWFNRHEEFRGFFSVWRVPVQMQPPSRQPGSLMSGDICPPNAGPRAPPDHCHQAPTDSGELEVIPGEVILESDHRNTQADRLGTIQQDGPHVAGSTPHLRRLSPLMVGEASSRSLQQVAVPIR